MDAVAMDNAVEPTEWFVVFHTKAMNPWLGRLACGKYKHVSALAYCPGFKAWLLFDAQWTGMRLILMPHETAKTFYAEYTADCAVLKMARVHQPMPVSSRWGFYCVPAIKHLLGLRCVAARPDGLYRSMLRNGAIRVDEQSATSHA
jgi:hypothetical protein